MTQADNTHEVLGRPLDRVEPPASRALPAPAKSPYIHPPTPERPLDMDTYRAGRQAATDAADAVRDALAGLGLPESVWRGIRPLVTHTGKSYVHVGMIRADAAAVLAQALVHVCPGCKNRLPLCSC